MVLQISLPLDFLVIPKVQLNQMKRIGRPRTGRVPNFSIRIKPEALHKAREAALNQNKTLGIWLKEAIDLKIRQESNHLKEENRDESR